MMTTIKNNYLNNAKRDKKDEFYTQYQDIEAEMSAYLESDKTAFKGKALLLPCDDPTKSQFTAYFIKNFKMLGLKELISTSLADVSKGEHKGRILRVTSHNINDVSVLFV